MEAQHYGAANRLTAPQSHTDQVFRFKDWRRGLARDQGSRWQGQDACLTLEVQKGALEGFPGLVGQGSILLGFLLGLWRFESSRIDNPE